MTSWSLWTALLGTYNLVSFHFLCLILFEYDSKCERVSAFSVMIFCADSVQWGSKTGVDHCRSCQQGFCCSGFCLTFCPTHFHIVHFSTFQVRRHLVQTSHVEQLLCNRLDSGSHTMTCWSLWWDMPGRLGKFSCVSFLTFMNIPSLTLTDIFSFVLLFLFSSFY